MLSGASHRHPVGDSWPGLVLTREPKLDSLAFLRTKECTFREQVLAGRFLRTMNSLCDLTPLWKRPALRFSPVVSQKAHLSLPDPELRTTSSSVPAKPSLYLFC